MSARTTRLQFLKTLGAGTAGIVLLGAAGCGRDEALLNSALQEDGSSVQAETLLFRSRPEFEPPAVEVLQAARDTADGYVFVAPKKGEAQPGAMILDN